MIKVKISTQGLILIFFYFSFAIFSSFYGIFVIVQIFSFLASGVTDFWIALLVFILSLLLFVSYIISILGLFKKQKWLLRHLILQLVISILFISIITGFRELLLFHWLEISINILATIVVVKRKNFFTN